MDGGIAVVVGTFGDRSTWAPLAEQAMVSAGRQDLPAAEIVWRHADTLAQARNEAAAATSAPWLAFLDADDALDDQYVAAMARSVARHTTDLVLHQPLTLGVYSDGSEDDEPVFIPPRHRSGSLEHGNHLVIGTLVSRRLFDAVGGFHEHEAFEDWCLFLRCQRAGATWFRASGAVYRVGVRPGSRNQIPPATAGRLVSEIRRCH